MSDGTEYASLRIKEVAHKLRFATSAKLVNAGGDQTITFRKEPFEHFAVEPGGIQIPLHNVASAIPKGARLANKLRTTGARKPKTKPARKPEVDNGDEAE